MSDNIKGKVIIITGASSGIGEATAKLLGGLYYDYSLKDDGPATLKPVDVQTQEQALTAMVGLLRPERLALPENLRYLIPPPVSGYDRDREFFSGQTGAR